MPIKAALTAALVVLVSGCSDLFSPLTGGADSYVASADARGPVIYSCGRVSPGVATGRATYVDIAFPLGFTTGTLRAIRAAGGIPLRLAEVNVVRAAIDPGRLAAMERYSHSSYTAFTARSVPDVHRFVVKVFVAFDHQATVGDSLMIVASGGVVDGVFAQAFYVAALMPNESIPQLRRAAGVRYVESDESAGCLF